MVDPTVELHRVVAALPEEVWRGHVRARQCDEMCHQNATFYLSQALEGQAAADAMLTGGTGGTLPVATAHQIRFLRELRAGTAIHLRAGLCRAAGRDVLLLALIDSEADAVSALIAAELAVSPPGAGALSCDLDIDRLFTGIPRERPAAVMPGSLPADLAVTARGIFMSPEADRGVGAVRLDALFARMADATHHYSRLFERTAARHDDGQVRLGTAAIECRFDYHRVPDVGERFLVRSAFAAFGRKARRLVHFMIAPDRREVFCTAHTLEVNFDLETRRARAVPASALEQLEPHLVRALAPDGLDA